MSNENIHQQAPTSPTQSIHSTRFDGPPIAIDARGLTKVFGNTIAVGNLTLGIPRGSILLWPSRP